MRVYSGKRRPAIPMTNSRCKGIFISSSMKYIAKFIVGVKIYYMQHSSEGFITDPCSGSEARSYIYI